MSKEVLGFVPIYEIVKGALATAACVICSECSALIRGMGGPLTGALCVDCAALRIHNIHEGDNP